MRPFAFIAALAWVFLVTVGPGADGAALITSSADSGPGVDTAQQSRFVRREPHQVEPVERSLAERPLEKTTPASLESQIQQAKQQVEDAIDRKTATEVKMQKLINDLRTDEERYDKLRMDAEARVHKLEQDKLQIQEELETSELLSSGPAPEETMVKDSAQRKAKEADRKQSESLQKALHDRVRSAAKESSKSAEKRHRAHATGKTQAKEVHEATVSGLPEVALGTEAVVITDKEKHLANLMKIIAQRERIQGRSVDSTGDAWCDLDYPLGLWNTSTCSSDGATQHKLIESEAECAQAAYQANATPGDGNNRYFRIPDEWGHLHPKGCFVFPCHWDPGHVCYWFNAQELQPKYPWGAPVCSRPRIRNGTEDTNSGCPDGYDVIMDENNCTEAASCKAYCLQQNYLVGVGYPSHNSSQHDLYPEGCFIHKEQGCVYYNPPYGPNPPQNPKGTPICNVTQITHFPEISLPWDIFW